MQACNDEEKFRRGKYDFINICREHCYRKKAAPVGQNDFPPPVPFSVFDL